MSAVMEVLKEFTRWRGWPTPAGADVAHWYSPDAMADEIVRLRRILAALREPSAEVVEQAARALYLRGDLSVWCTWEDEIARYKATYYEDALPIIRAAVAAAEQEVTNTTTI